MLLRDNYQCCDCKRVVTGRAAHVDHIVPKAAGGSDEITNLVTRCVSCHSKREGWHATRMGKAKTAGLAAGMCENF